MRTTLAMSASSARMQAEGDSLMAMLRFLLVIFPSNIAVCCQFSFFPSAKRAAMLSVKGG